MANTLTLPACTEGQLDPEEAAWIAAAQRDPSSFACLYDRYVARVYRYLYSRTGSPVEAQDLTSQVFLKALEALPSYQHRGHFAAWLFAIARRAAVDSFRIRKREAPLETAEHLSRDADPLAHTIQSEEARRLRSLIQTLTEEEQELIRLRYVAELPFAQIAELLHRREDAVKKSLYRLLARLQSQMEA